MMDYNDFIIQTEFSHFSGHEIQRIGRSYQQLIPNQSKRIGLHIDNSADWLAIDLICHKSNRTLIPIPNFFNQDQVSHLISSAEVQTLITQDRLLLKKYGFSDNQDSLGDIFIGSIPFDQLSKGPCDLRDVQKITFTSGSTGDPKGVCLSSRAQWQVATDLKLSLNRLKIKSHLTLLPFSILLENVAGAYTSMALGNTNFVFSLKTLGFNGVSFDESKCIDLIQKHQIESLILLPQMLQQVTDFLIAKDIHLDSLKFVAVGGAKVPVDLIKKAKSTGLPVYEGYGLSECSSVVSVNLPQIEKVGTVGQLLSSRKVRIIDNEIEVFLDEGLRYFNGDTIPPSWFKTGDIGYFDNRFLVINGRKNNLLITSMGRNISPEWPESLLVNEKEIYQAMVTCENKPYLKALVVGAAGKSIYIPEAIARVNKQLPSYSQINDYEIISIPFTFEDGTLTANGRLRRAEILKRTEQELNLYESEIV